MLAQGYRRGPSFSHNNSRTLESNIGGLSILYPNQYVQSLKEEPWLAILRVLGKGGDLIMMDLLLDCGIFRQLDAGRGNYYQISGGYIIILDIFS